MKALDTNVIVRFLVRDDERQAQIVYRIFKQVESNKEVLFVPLLVVIETIWVLESVYEISRQEILESMHDLLLMPILEFESQSAVQSFVSSAQETKIEEAAAAAKAFTASYINNLSSPGNIINVTA